MCFAVLDESWISLMFNLFFSFYFNWHFCHHILPFVPVVWLSQKGILMENLPLQQTAFLINPSWSFASQFLPLSHCSKCNLEFISLFISLVLSMLPKVQSMYTVRPEMCGHLNITPICDCKRSHSKGMGINLLEQWPPIFRDLLRFCHKSISKVEHRGWVIKSH